MRQALAGFSLGLLMTTAPGPPQGLKIVVRETSPAGVLETTTYVLDDRSRTEWRRLEPPPGPGDDLTAQIVRCDLRKTIALSYGDRTFMASTSMAAITSRSVRLFGPARVPPARVEPPDVVVETETVRTGERKTAFGHAARRVVTTRTRRPLAVSAGEPGEFVTDGWYIDLDPRPSCERDMAMARLEAQVVAGHPGERRALPRVAYRDIGEPERGYPIEVKMTSRAGSPSGGDPFVTHTRVTELVRGPIDPALFEIPPGFRHAGGPLAALAERWSGAWTWLRMVLYGWSR